MRTRSGVLIRHQGRCDLLMENDDAGGAGFRIGNVVGSSAYGATLTERGMRDVTLASGDVVRVEAGDLVVPESRKRPSARRVVIPYYLLQSESDTPAAPIFLLAGGPGASWIDQFARDENYREVGIYRSLARSRTSCCRPARCGTRPTSNDLPRESCNAQ